MNKARGFQNGWWLVVITVAVMLASSIPTAFVETNAVYVLLGEIALFLPVVIGLFMLNNELPDGGMAGELGIRRFSLKLLPFLLLLAPTAQSFSSFVALPIQLVLRFLLGMPDYTFLDEPNTFWINFVTLCVIAPVVEELLCRGVIMAMFKRYGTAKMLIWSSLAFAMLHLGGEGIVPIFLLGLLLGSIRITTGSLVAAITAHSASNLYSLIMLSLPEMNVLLQLAFTLLTAIAFPFLMCFFLRKTQMQNDWKNELSPKNERTGFSWGLTTMAALFIVYNLIVFFSRAVSGDIFYEFYGMLGL